MKSFLIKTLIILIILISCKSTDQQEHIEYNTDSFKINYPDTSHTLKVKKIFYNVPSPLEMSKILQRSNAIFQRNLIYPYTEVYKFTSTPQQALLLGLYGSDLAYVRLFEQIQLALNYITAIKTLFEALEVPYEQGAKSIERLEKNINNKDSLLKTITETFTIADNYFKEIGKGNIATLVLLGGWIETLYLSSNGIDYNDSANNEIIQRIGEQKLSLSNLIELIKIYPDDKTLQNFLPKLLELKLIYDEVKINHKSSEIITDTINKTTIIKNISDVFISKETFEKIKLFSQNLREEIIKI